MPSFATRIGFRDACRRLQLLLLLLLAGIE
jgi:hypothetical protein